MCLVTKGVLIRVRRGPDSSGRPCCWPAAGTLGRALPAVRRDKGLGISYTSRPQPAEVPVSERQRPSAPRGRRRSAHVGVVARHDADVDDADLAVTDGLYGFFQACFQLGEILHGTDPHSPLCPRHHREIEVGLVDALADPLVLHRPRALLRHTLLVQLVVVEGAVVRHHQQAGHLVVRRGPQRRHAHQEVAVAEDAGRDAPRALQRERRADDQPGPRPDPAAAVGAEVVERMAEMAVRAVPAERQTREADVQSPRRLIECVRQRPDRQRVVCGLGRFFCLGNAPSS